VISPVLARVMAAALALTLVLAACSAPTEAPPPSGQTLRVGVASLPSSLGNPYRGNGRPGSLLWLAIFDGLTRLNDTGELEPALALDWTLVEPTVWRFTLREGVIFSNGRPFDAEAVREVFQWLGSPEGQRTLIGIEMRDILEVRVISDHEVEIETASPEPILPRRLVTVMMVEPEALRGMGADAFSRAPIGTGAFVMTRWDQRRRHLILDRNPGSWRASRMERVVFVELPSSAGRTQALLSGDVDLSLIDLEEMDRLEHKGFPVLSTPSMQVKAYTFRVEGGDPDSPMRDVRVRRALNYAVDKDAISALMPDGAAPSGQPAPSGVFGHDPSIQPYPYDPDRARALLAEAGYPQGFDLTMEVMTDAAPGDDLMSQAVAEYWRQIGVRTRLSIVTMPDYLSKLLANDWSGHAFALSWNSFQYYDVTRAMNEFSCARRVPFFCDRVLTEQFQVARMIQDEAERLAAFQKLARGYHEAAPSVFLVEHRDLFAHSPRLEGVRIRHRVPVYEEIVFQPR